MHGVCALVLPVRTTDGMSAVLKLTWRHPEARNEHLASRPVDGARNLRPPDGIRRPALPVRVLDHAAAVLGDLMDTAGPVLLHTDLHDENVLAW